MSLLAVILAAGGGSRFAGDTHKLVAPFRGSTVLAYAVAAAVDSGVGPVLVIVGDDVMGAEVGDGVDVLVNHQWAEGQATSLQLAIVEAGARAVDAVVVGLGDQPLVPPEAWRAVAHAPGGPIVTATFAGERRPPVRLDRAAWPLLPTDGDEGARVAMRRHPELVTAIDVPGEPADIDTLEDLSRWS